MAGRPLGRIFVRPPSGLPKFTAAFWLAIIQRKLKFTAKILYAKRNLTFAKGNLLILLKLLFNYFIREIKFMIKIEIDVRK